MEAEEKKRETDKNVKRLQDEIMASIKSIYQSIENIGKVNKEVAQMLITRIQTLRADTDNKQIQPFEMLSELMSIQREIIGILDTDYYKQTTMYFQPEKKRGIEVHDKNMLPVVSQDLKQGFWHKLFGKITRKQLGKHKTEISSDYVNTPTINRIAVDRNENVDKKYPFVVVDENGFKEDFRYPVYEQLKKIENSEVGLEYRETIQLNEEKNRIRSYGNSLEIWIDGRIVELPFETGRHIEIDGNVINLPTFETGIEESEFGKVIKFAKFLGGTKER